MEKFSAIAYNVREQFRAWFSTVIILILLSFLFFVAGGGVSHNIKWRISHIDISGASAVSADAVRSLALEKLVGNYYFVYARENSYLFPKTEIEQTILQTFPRLASVSAKRIDNHTITIVTTERKPYALWCGEQLLADVKNNKCWFIDETGFVFDQAPLFSKGVYIEVYGKLIERNTGEPLRGALSYDRFANANTFAKLIHDNVGKPFRITLRSEGELDVTIQTSVKSPFLDGVVVRFKDELIPTVLLKNLVTAIPVQFPDNIALKKKLLYIDMRFGNKVIFGFENQ